MEFNISEIPICRICLNKVQIGETFFLVNDYAKTSNFEGLLIKNMIQKIVSEIDLEICNHPIICGQCYNLLISTYTFKSKCFETEEKIHEYMKTNGFQVGDKINLTDLIEPETSIVKEEKIDKTENNIDEDIVSSTANDCKEEIDTNGPQVGDKINIVESEIKMEVEEEKTDSTENDTDDDDEDYKEELDVDIEEDDLKPKSKNRNLAYMRRPHKCDICEYKSYNYAYLKKHLKKCKVKQSKEIFKCNKCPYSTTRNRNLNRHMMIHGGDRPYSCGICKKGFTERSHVKRHIARHSGSGKLAIRSEEEEEDSGTSIAGKRDVNAYIIKNDKYKPFTCDSSFLSLVDETEISKRRKKVRTKKSTKIDKDGGNKTNVKDKSKTPNKN